MGEALRPEAARHSDVLPGKRILQLAPALLRLRDFDGALFFAVWSSQLA